MAYCNVGDITASKRLLLTVVCCKHPTLRVVGRCCHLCQDQGKLKDVKGILREEEKAKQYIV